MLVEAAALLDLQLGGRGAIIGRLGEASFGVLLPGVDRATSVRTASELRAVLEARSPEWGVAGLGEAKITVSVGVAVAVAGRRRCSGR